MSVLDYIRNSQVWKSIFRHPAPRPLERWAVSIGDDGQIVVDKSKKFQQERGEWVNPESFIKV